MGVLPRSFSTDGLLDELRADNRSGASEMARRAANGLLAFCAQPFASASALVAELSALGQRIIESQPSMAPLFNLINQTLLNVEALDMRDSVPALQEVATRAIREFLRSSETARRAIAEIAQGLLPRNGSVMTHSSSGTVVEILRQALSGGKELRALATESRPLCEGRELARHLGQSGIPTSVVLDAAVARYVREADIVIVGADRVTEQSFVNKVGTSPLAMAAREAQVPLYVACELNKFLPADVVPVDATLEPPEQRQQEEWMNVELLYTLFESTPNAWVTGFITEAGILSLHALAKQFRTFKVSLALQERCAPEPGLLARTFKNR